MQISKITVQKRRIFLLPVMILGIFVAAIQAGRAEQTVTDSTITEVVASEFIEDQAVPFDEINVKTQEGIVRLTGAVDSLLAKERAERIVEMVKGVRAVINQLKVEPSIPRDADQLRNDVRDALLHDPATDTHELTVRADDEGIVTIGGTVDSWAERNLAETVAKNVLGVTGVKNTIVVQQKSARPDAEIEKEVEQRLRYNILVDHALIDVRVDNARVRLSGIVGSGSERREARFNAWVSGVQSVDVSGLKVERWARDEDLRKGKYTLKSDQEVENAIRSALEYNPRVEPENIIVRVRSGAAYLSGSVDNVASRRSAERTARNTVGVVLVKNRIKVRPARDISDEATAKRVKAALARNPLLDDESFSVTVDDGVVHLRGHVDEYHEKALADNVAARIEGVVLVENTVSVGDTSRPYIYNPYIDPLPPYRYGWYDYRPGYTPMADSQIEKRIRDELFWSPFVDSGDVTVQVDGGVATLTGTVDTLTERDAAQQNALEGGAIWVVNKLKVELASAIR